MNTSVFPVLPGLHWEFKVEDEFRVLTNPAVNPGFDTTTLLGPDPLLHFDLSYNWLREPGSPDGSLPAGGDDELQILRGFFRSVYGNAVSFLLDLGALTQNPGDSSITGQPLTPDASGVAPLAVTGSGLFSENLYELQPDSVLYMNGAAMTLGTDYTIQGPGVAGAGGVTYPGLAAVITKTIAGPVTADLGWYYRVKFKQSSQQFDRFLALLYSAQQVQLVTSRT